MTCLQIQMLLHYYAIAEPYAMERPEHANSTAVMKQRSQLVCADMLREEVDQASGYVLTDKGLVFVKHILSLPFPERTWRMPCT